LIFRFYFNENNIFNMVEKTINVNWIEIDMTTYRLADLYDLYIWDYNNLEEIKEAINKEIEIRQNILIKETKTKIGL